MALLIYKGCYFILIYNVISAKSSQSIEDTWVHVLRFLGIHDEGCTKTYVWLSGTGRNLVWTCEPL